MHLLELVHALLIFFFFNDTATTEIYTLSLHDALPISARAEPGEQDRRLHLRARHRERPVDRPERGATDGDRRMPGDRRSEEHTSELQSPCNLVCRLLLEKKKRT